MHGEETACLQDFNVPQSFVAGFEEQCRERIAGLQARSRQGLWGLTLFALLSAGIYAAPVSTALISPKMFDLLGPSPPVSLISLALVIYCFSALVLVGPGHAAHRRWRRALSRLVDARLCVMFLRILFLCGGVGGEFLGGFRGWRAAAEPGVCRRLDSLSRRRPRGTGRHRTSSPAGGNVAFDLLATANEAD